MALTAHYFVATQPSRVACNNWFRSRTKSVKMRPPLYGVADLMLCIRARLLVGYSPLVGCSAAQNDGVCMFAELEGGVLAGIEFSFYMRRHSRLYLRKDMIEAVG